MRRDPYIRNGELVQDCSFCKGEGTTTEMKGGDGYSFDGVSGPENPLLVYRRVVRCTHCNGKKFNVLKTAQELEAEERAKRKEVERQNTPAPDKKLGPRSDTQTHDTPPTPDYGKTAMVGTIFGVLLAIAGSGSVLVGAIAGAIVMVALVFFAEIMKLGLTWFLKGLKYLTLIALSLAGLMILADLALESLK